jgi:hypothetical protein
VRPHYDELAEQFQIVGKSADGIGCKEVGSIDTITLDAFGGFVQAQHDVLPDELSGIFGVNPDGKLVHNN